VEERVRPVDRAGLYVPGGRAAYPSTVLMTAITAAVAGVPERVLCVPPGPDGSVPGVTLAAAELCGVEEVYRIGGAQAVAAMAYGTETIRAVDVVVGPGNAYVDAAKRLVAGRGVVAIDGPAGPSELVVIADADADPVQAALDLAAQAEHGPGGRAVVVAWDPHVLDAVTAALEGYLADGARVAEITATLATGGQAVLVRDAVQAVEVANLVAPEHLELLVADPDPLLSAVRHAGAVFVGVPTAVGDYVAGPNHVLPTGGAARFASALRVDDFRTRVHVVRAAGDLDAVGSAAITLAGAEGLLAHARSVEHRIGR
jgi:histidinol dehydrogenase